MGSEAAAPFTPVSKPSSASRMRGGFIYQLVNTLTGDRYVYGTTLPTPEERWRSHRYAALFGGRTIDQAMRRYGSDAFEMEVLAYCPTWWRLRKRLEEYYQDIPRPDVFQTPKHLRHPELYNQALSSQPEEAVPTRLRCPYRLPYGYENRHLLRKQQARLQQLLRRYPKVKQGLGQVLTVTQLSVCWELRASQVFRALERIAKRSRGQVVIARGYDDGTGTLVFERPWWRDYMLRDEALKVVRIYVGPGPSEVQP